MFERYLFRKDSCKNVIKDNKVIDKTILEMVLRYVVDIKTCRECAKGCHDN